jgi:hypothetical protein
VCSDAEEASAKERAEMNWLKKLIEKIKEWFKPKPKPLPEDIDPAWRRGAWDRYAIDAWPVTINVDSAYIRHLGGNEYEAGIQYDHLQTLPAWYQQPDPEGLNKGNVNGAIHLVRKYGGEWVFASIDYLRVGQTAKHFVVLPEYLVEAHPGEAIGIVVSTTARQHNGTRVDGDPNGPYRERSKISWTYWP